MSTRLEWAEAIQKGMGIDPYHDGDIAWVNLFVAEGSRATDNPDDTIQPEPGATAYNTFDGSLHVWNYPSFQEGLDAVVKTINNGLNTKVIEAFKAKEDAEHLTAIFATASSWDSAGALYINTLPRTIADFASLAAVEVAGKSEVTPAPAPVPDPVPAPVLTQVEKVESAIGVQADQAQEASTEGKASKVRDLVAKLKTHLAELEELTK